MNKGGAPKGNKNAASGQLAKRALIKALEIRSGHAEPDELLDRFKPLVEIWDKQLDKAIEDGDNGSANMIVERLDGKAKQVVDVPEESKGESTGWVLMPVRAYAADADSGETASADNKA